MSLATFNVNSIDLGLVAATGQFTPDFVPSQWVVDKYDNADIRKAARFERKLLTIKGVDYPTIWLVNKYPCFSRAYRCSADRCH